MTSAQLFYIINILIYAGVDIVACPGLSQQFGVAGVTDFGFIIFQATGAYAAAILSLPADTARLAHPTRRFVRNAGNVRYLSKFSVKLFSANTLCTYTMNYLRQEKYLRDHGLAPGWFTRWRAS
jgi:ABC-type branched-subunit amino acid transport system permease subunit